MATMLYTPAVAHIRTRRLRRPPYRRRLIRLRHLDVRDRAAHGCLPNPSESLDGPAPTTVPANPTAQMDGQREDILSDWRPPMPAHWSRQRSGAPGNWRH